VFNRVNYVCVNMNHASKKEQYRNFNTFRFFDQVYNQNENKTYNHLEQPEQCRQSKGLIALVISVLVLVLLSGAIIPYFLSYILKTPYPLVVIAEDIMEPTIYKNDLVLVKGVVDPSKLRLGDMVLYYTGESSSLAVRKIGSINSDSLAVASDLIETSEQQINFKQVVGQVVVNGNKPIKLPRAGFLSAWLN